MTVSTHHLAALVAEAGHLAERARLAAFLRGDGVAFAANPFPATSAGAVRQVWAGRAFEYAATGREVAGLESLLAATAALGPAEPLAQDILRAGSCTLYLYRAEAGIRVVGAVLAGRPGAPLPEFGPEPSPPGRRSRKPAAQLDLFAAGIRG